jgi:FMN reductase
VNAPLIVGLGGTLRIGSSSEIALRVALDAAERAGARTRLFAAADLNVPFYDQKSSVRTPEAAELISALRAADGVVVSSPGYHGAISGMIKNALDYVEDLAGDSRVYLDGLPFGCISVAHGNQAAAAVLANLRSIAHALRAFPTAYGAAIVSGPRTFDAGECVETDVRSCLVLLGTQVTQVARLHADARISAGSHL